MMAPSASVKENRRDVFRERHLRQRGCLDETANVSGCRTRGDREGDCPRSVRIHDSIGNELRLAEEFLL
jgi:hypothetical protein